ncbi:kinase-like domain-containing protein [Suillus bovinus]|uniref:kinase-like domain-containing protein n=1 Tax=Suillus bovinus TaxID=48563 RepID=UPI001B87B855|nr:kinase-like domain-containing protein [Suillus bovinus]KAG2130809.1 kinase-like domain-containing protein [Suillus bovinus]
MIPVRVNGRYRLKDKVGSGAYGEVYHASDIIGECLEHKYNVLRQLGDTVGIPHVHWFGREDSYDALVLDHLGQSLESVFKAYQHSFSHNTIVFIAHQLVCRLQYIHSKHFIHRNLKPNDILIGTGKDAAQDFSSFTSINSHAGMELGHRDDIESLAYLLIYLFCGSLPWLCCSGISDKQVVEMKYDTMKLCQDLPEEVEQILTYSCSLSFDQKPDYAFLCRLLQRINIVDLNGLQVYVTQ